MHLQLSGTIIRLGVDIACDGSAWHGSTALCLSAVATGFSLQQLSCTVTHHLIGPCGCSNEYREKALPHELPHLSGIKVNHQPQWT